MHWELMKLRKIHKLTKTDMMKILDIKNIETYTSKENGEVDFKLSEMFTIARYFNKKMEEIFLPRYIGKPDKREGMKCSSN